MRRPCTRHHRCRHHNFSSRCVLVIFSMNAYHLSKIKKLKTTLSGFEVKGTTKGWIDGTSSPTHWFFLKLIPWKVIYPVAWITLFTVSLNTLLPIKRHQERRMVKKRNLRALARICEIHLPVSYFYGLYLNGSLISEKSAYLNRLFETSSSPCATAPTQTMQNIVMVTVEFSLDNTE